MSDLRKHFEGGTAAVTGAASGVGEGLARQAAALGMAVAIGDIDIAAAERVAESIRVQGGRAVAIEVDVRSAEAVDRFAAAAYESLGAVTLAINNAGVEQFGYLWDTPVENWDRLMSINVSGVFYGIRAFVPRMRDAGAPARIWNVSSLGGIGFGPLQAPYIVSKHAVLALTESLKVDLDVAGLGIQVAAIVPGAVTSRIFEEAGGVETGDTAASAATRGQMLQVMEQAMSPLEAAEIVFEQAARGKFYLYTHPEISGMVVETRAEQLRSGAAPEAPRG